jgi:Eco57I restriction-modification methylase
VLGNPPYVKLQNMMKVDPDVVAYLRADRRGGAYETAQSGNFDLYLPFIEKGLRLLAEGGRMAYIAPSLWTVNDYGAGLRGLIHRTRQLERWIDFKSFQVFEEAITYTALQFFTQSRNETVRITTSPEGQIGDIEWNDKTLAVPSEDFEADGQWLMLTGEERETIQKLNGSSPQLGDAQVTQAIFQGLITSADHIYSLRRLSRNRYACTPPKSDSFEVEIEDGIMRPLISGPEAKRYESLLTETYILFPYAKDARSNNKLIPQEALRTKYPLAWRHLLSFEKELRNREQRAFDDEFWYRFGRSQALDKQELPKLIVAQTVPSLRVSADFDANKYLNNVRVNGILPAKGVDLAFLLGVLNGSAADFVFRRIGKPKQGGWFEANKQFIAPLPIPKAAAKQQAQIGERARELQEQWTRRRDLFAEADARLGTLSRATYKPNFLWPDLPDAAGLKAQAPKALTAHEKTEWAHQLLQDEVEKRIEALQGFLNAAKDIEATFHKGELRLSADGRLALSRIFLDDKPGQFAAIYWRYLLLKNPTDAPTFARSLGRLPSPHDSPAARQFSERVTALVEETALIRRREREMNDALYDLYGLTDEERLLIDNDCAKRPLL